MKKGKENDIVGDGFVPKTIFIVLLLLTIHFWKLRFIPQKFNAEDLFVWFVCGYCLIMVYNKKELQFKNAIFLFTFGLLLNIFSAYLNLGQSPYRTFLAFANYYFVFLYFLMHYLKLSIRFIEKVIIIFAIIFSIIYVIQTIIFPLWIVDADVQFGRGSIRINMVGHGFLMLAYALMLNRYFLNFKLWNILFPIGFLVILLMIGYRTLIAGALFISAVMFLKTVKFKVQYLLILFLIVILLVGLFQFELPSRILGGFVNDTQSNIAQGDKYVRLVQLDFFFNIYPQNILYFILGGGIPAGDNINNFNPDLIGQNYNIVWVDLGLLGFYIVIGAVALIGLLWYTLKAIFIKLPKDKLYLNMYFLFLLVVSFTTEEIYRPGMFSVHAIGLYLIDMIVINEKPKQEKEISIKNTKPLSNS